MKKYVINILLVLTICLTPTLQSYAQMPIVDIIKAGVKKVIKAIDLKIQRLQNKTIWLQNAQKVLENKMSELKLTEISDWAGKQKELYRSYFDELQQVKNLISTYRVVKEIISRQTLLVREYSKAYSLSRQDKNFTPDELNYMQDVYSGILDESMKNIEQLQLVINAYTTQMSDAERLEIIHAVSDKTEQNISDLRQFNQQNIRISLQRSKDKNDIEVVKKLYGIR
jgi:hypothetical protein